MAEVAAPDVEEQVAVPVSDPAPEETEQPAKTASFSGENDFSAPAGSGGVFGSIRDFWSSVLQADDPPKIVVSKEDYKLGSFAAGLDNYFRITERNSTFGTEFTGGMTTFFSMCYIMVLNGVIIGGAFNTGMAKTGVFFATALASGIFTFFMGAVTNLPVALAPGMGLNGYFASIVGSCAKPDHGPFQPQYMGLYGPMDLDNPLPEMYGQCESWGKTKLPWTDAMGAVFISGWFYLFFTFTGLRTMLFRAVPKSLRAAITVGIGFFITIIGLKIGEITRVTQAPWSIGDVTTAAGCVFKGDGSGIAFCANPVDINFATYEMGISHFNENPHSRIAVIGLVFVALFTVLRLKGAIIMGICMATFIGINYWAPLKGDSHSGATAAAWYQPGGPDVLPKMTLIPSGKLTFKYANTPIFWDAVWSFLFVELFDSFGTLTGIMTRAGFMKGDPEKAMTKVNRAMCVDGFGLWLGAIIGSNSITCYIESNTGIEAGARTGFASIVTGCAFLLSLLFIAPFVAIIPDAATTCALVMVGVYSLDGVKDINFDDMIDQLAAFFTIATMGFTYSIANGICTGFIFFSWMRVARFVYQKGALKLRPSAAYEASVDCTLPHPMMLLMASFMAIRFAYLGA